ncbi:hypothetical protein GIB67_039614 [Kingdonia uniflora]|uniref:Uncharacterized protein n=1 Tax=Kingdonia uniflora TaxID=39325 RepID=A0A7J7MDG8_9MAGN|nr:hypothetical protein GIB67_039614 [Kingdonia uniflora]
MKRIKARTMVISSSRSFVIVKYILKCEMLTFSLFILQLSMRGAIISRWIKHSSCPHTTLVQDICQLLIMSAYGNPLE